MRPFSRLLRFRFPVLLALLLTAAGCNVTKNIPEGEYLLVKNTIKSDKPGFKDNLNSIIKQKPNKKVLGIFRFHLSVYNFAQKGKENGFKRWLKRAIGEEPVLLDTALTRKSAEQMVIFYQNNGYFHASLQDSTTYRNKKASVFYNITTGPAYHFRSLSYEISDSTLKTLVFSDTSKRLIREHGNFSTTVLQKERERISARLRNHGYYFFNPLYITYLVDTFQNSRKVDVILKLNNPKSSVRDTSAADSLLRHPLTALNDVIIEMDYDPLYVDTALHKDTTVYQGLKFIASYPVEYRYEPKHYAEHIFLRKDSLFAQDDVDLTYRRLSDLGMFRFVNIRFEDKGLTDSLGRRSLTNYINLAPAPRQDFKIEVEGTNNGGNFGIAGNIVYRNKNIFKGAEILTFKVKGGLELQRNFSDTTYESIKQLGFFNAYEFGPEISITFPRALWPFKNERNKRVNNPSTSVTLGYNVQNRPEYYRQLFNMSYYFTKKTSRFSRIYLYPAEMNYLNVDLDPAFVLELIQLGDINIIFGYVDQFISNGRISYVFNNQELNVRKDYMFFKANLEFAGNTLYLYKTATGNEPNSSRPEEIFNVVFAQYIRPDFDFRYYKPLSLSNSILACRFYSGLGYAYGNSELLPFEKSFYAGGPIDMRAWRTRQLGPGGISDENAYERYGDLKLLSSIEYRFDIYKKIKGAAFIDAGNIWAVKDYYNDPLARFNFSTFASQIAFGGGLGIRLDLSFFIIRLDGAVKMKDPSNDPGERWVIKNNKLTNTTFNFAIGYPF